jgi:hypothetical protein
MQSRNLKELSEAKTLALLEKFEEWGREHARNRWPDALRRLAPLYGLTARGLDPVDKEAARILRRARIAFERGRATGSSAKGDPRPARIAHPGRKRIAS